jgi:hypothetical protein
MYLLVFILRTAQSEGLLVRFPFSQDPKSCCCGPCVVISEQGSAGNGSRGLLKIPPFFFESQEEGFHPVAKSRFQKVVG